MAKPILATDFKDDIMQEDMNGKRRYRMINNTDGTVSFEDATDYEQIGNVYGAGQINATNEAVNQSVDSNKLVKELSTISAITQEGYVPDALAVKELNSSLGNLKFAQNAEGKWGYIPSGADAVIPFNNGIDIKYIGKYTSNTTVDVSAFVDENTTSSNFFLVVNSFSKSQNTQGVHNDTISNASVSYNTSTKKISVVVPKWTAKDTTTAYISGSLSGTVTCYFTSKPLPTE